MPLPLMHDIQRALEHLQQGGFSHLLEIACAYRRIPHWLYFRHSTHLLRLRSPEHVLTYGARPDYQYFTADISHLDELSALDPFENIESIERLFRKFFELGASCFAIRKQDRIIAYNWLFRSRYTVTNDGYRSRQMELLLRTGEAIFGNGYILPEYRMKGLFPSLIQMAVRDNPRDTAFFCTIDMLNTNSLRAHHRIGFFHVGTLRCERILGQPYSWSWESPVADKHRVGTGQPAVTLSALTATT